MEGKLDTVNVLVGKSEGDAFSGFIDRFGGEEVAAYHEGEDNAITCTLYLCQTDRGRGTTTGFTKQTRPTPERPRTSCSLTKRMPGKGAGGTLTTALTLRPATSWNVGRCSLSI